ncbi:MAG: hypothetical protein ACREKN_04470 [Longimicrobiaceae bacterium]
MNGRRKATSPPEQGDTGPDGGGLPPHPPCPFCDSPDTQLISPFGGQMSVAQYWCGGCRTGFEYLKWGDTPRGDSLSG